MPHLQYLTCDIFSCGAFNLSGLRIFQQGLGGGWWCGVGVLGWVVGGGVFAVLLRLPCGRLGRGLRLYSSGRVAVRGPKFSWVEPSMRCQVYVCSIVGCLGLWLRVWGVWWCVCTFVNFLFTFVHAGVWACGEFVGWARR